MSKLSLLRIGLRLMVVSLPQGVLPACGEQGTQAQSFGCRPIFTLMVHDPIGGSDGPFRAGAIHELKRRIRFDRAFLEDPKIPSCEAGAFNLQGQILDAPAAG